MTYWLPFFKGEVAEMPRGPNAFGDAWLATDQVSNRRFKLAFWRCLYEAIEEALEMKKAGKGPQYRECMGYLVRVMRRQEKIRDGVLHVFKLRKIERGPFKVIKKAK